MAESVDIDFSEITEYLLALSDTRRALLAIKEGMDTARFELRNRVVENLSGKILNRVTGQAARSVFVREAKILGNQVTLEYGADTTASSYLTAHEFGAAIPGRFVRPVNAKVLAWETKSGVTAFSKGHFIPGFQLPERAPFRKAGEASLRFFVAHIGVQAIKALRDATR